MGEWPFSFSHHQAIVYYGTSSLSKYAITLPHLSPHETLPSVLSPIDTYIVVDTSPIISLEHSEVDLSVSKYRKIYHDSIDILIFICLHNGIL
jgi:hypothetical protein